MHQGFEGPYEPWAAEIKSRPQGSAGRRPHRGAVTAYAMTNLQERGVLFVEADRPRVYQGIIVGENSRADDMDVNITREKKQTNVRSATSDRPSRSSSRRS